MGILTCLVSVAIFDFEIAPSMVKITILFDSALQRTQLVPICQLFRGSMYAVKYVAHDILFLNPSSLRRGGGRGGGRG